MHVRTVTRIFCEQQKTGAATYGEHSQRSSGACAHNLKARTMKHDKTLTHNTKDVNGERAPLEYIGFAAQHSGNNKIYLVTGVSWLGATDEWGVTMKAQGENIEITRPLSHMQGLREDGSKRYRWLTLS